MADEATVNTGRRAAELYNEWRAAVAFAPFGPALETFMVTMARQVAELEARIEALETPNTDDDLRRERDQDHA